MFVNIVNGIHRNESVSGVFELVRDYKETSNGGTVQVKVEVKPPFMVDRPRIKVTPDDYFYCDHEGNPLSDDDVATMANQQSNANSAGQTPASLPEVSYQEKYLAQEDEEDAVVRIRKTFSMLDQVTDATIQGKIRAAIISGPPGIGKSFGVEEKLRTSPYNLKNNISGTEDAYTIAKGSISGIGLYTLLWENRTSNQIIMFDDCDQVLYDEECLNLLKAALDSSDRRIISWRKKSRYLEDEDIPNSFEFKGSVMFLTNIDFTRTRSSKLRDHLNAIMSRCHYLDLEILSVRDQLLRIKQIVQDGMLSRYQFRNDEERKIIEYVEENAQYLNELSLRMVIKIADLVDGFPSNWEEMAEATCMKREAKFRRLFKESDTLSDTEDDTTLEEA